MFFKKLKISSKMKSSKIDREKLLELNKTFTDLKLKLINYIGRRLNRGIENKIIKKGFYSVEGVLDEVYLMSFDELEENPENFNPKISLFKNTIDKLNEILKSAKIFSHNVRVDKLLEQELMGMKENFTTDADGDLIPEEELTDISYHLKENHEKVLLTDNQTNKDIGEDLDDYDSALLQSERFENMGSLSKTIVELFVFGNLTTREIADVLDINIDDIQFILKQLKI